jgi:hypothetical protein
MEQTFAESLVKIAAPEDEIVQTLENSPKTVTSPDTVGTIKAPVTNKEPVTSRNLFRNHDTHPMIFYVFLSDYYGPLWVTWLPESLWLVIERDFKTSIATVSKEKINAVKTLLMVDSFWREWEIFEKVAHALNNNVSKFNMLQPPSLGQLVNAVMIAARIRHDLPFEEEIGRYVAAVAKNEGVEYLPAPLNFAQKFLGEIPKDVEDRYQALSKIAWTEADIQETAPDIQSLKLLLAQGYAQYRKTQLVEQGRTVAK